VEHRVVGVAGNHKDHEIATYRMEDNYNLKKTI